jgi:hypothetical protein
MPAKGNRSLGVYLRNQARDRLTQAEKGDFFSKLSNDQEFLRYLSGCGVCIATLSGAWEFKLRNSKTDLPYEIWTNIIAVDKYGGRRLGDGPQARVTLNHALDVLVAQARNSVSPQRLLTIWSGGRGGGRGQTRDPRARRFNRGHN